MGQAFGGKALATVIDRQRPVQVRVDIDARTGIGAAARARLELEQATVELDRIIVPDGALILEGADALEVGGSGLPGGLGMCRRVCEARIVARQEPVEHALRCFERPGLREPQFGDEAILEGPEESFDPTFSLRRGGGNPANAQFLKGAPDLRGGHRASQLLCQGERGAGIAVKQAMAIGVGRRGTP